MDSVPELLISFKNLPQPARHSLLTQLTPKKAIRLCNTDRETKKLCKEDFDVWIDRINKECEEYEAVGEKINSNNAYDKYIECHSERKRYKEIYYPDNIDQHRLALIQQGNLLGFIRSDPTRIDRYGKITYFQLACQFGKLNIAKWLHTKFRFNDDEAKRDSNFSFRISCMKGHLDIAKWLHVTFNVTDQDVAIYDNAAFRAACNNGYMEVARWLNRTFNLRLTPEQRTKYRECL